MTAAQSLAELERLSLEGTPIPPADAEFVGASGTGGAGASNAQSLPAVAGKKNYLLGFIVTTTQPATVLNGVVTVTGLSIGTLSFQIVESTAAGGQLVINFPRPLPASALNTAITVTLPAIVTGGSSAVAVYGFVR